MHMRKLILGWLIIALASPVLSQQITNEDYKRAVGLMWSNLAGQKIFNLSIRPEWFADSSGFSYQLQSGNGMTYQKYDFRTGKLDSLFDHKRLSKALSEATGSSVSAKEIRLGSLRFTSRTTMSFIVGGKKIKLDLSNYALTRDSSTENDFESKSPDGKWLAYTENYNLFIRSTLTGEVRQLSKNGKKNYEYASFYGWGDIIEGENGERPRRFAATWSPDSKWLQTSICDLSRGQKMYLLDWSVDSLYRPQLLSYYRASPGDTDMIYDTPVFFNVETGQELVQKDFRSVQGHSPEYEWTKETGIVYSVYFPRGYHDIEIFRTDLNHSKIEKLYKETSATNIDGFSHQLIEDWRKIVLLSEKDGWRQFYLLDLNDGSVKSVTHGDYYVNDVEIDKKNKAIFFEASGREAGLNPYFRLSYRVGIDGKGVRLLTPENANHEVSYSPDMKYMVDNISSPDSPTASVLRETQTGKIVRVLSVADVEQLRSMHYRYPETFTATARDGLTTIYGVIYKPTNFDSLKKYPVIDQTYTGPHTHMFPESFVSSLARSNQALAELGFVVVTIDGMGTAGRSKAFHNVSYKNMGKNLLDHVLAIRQLGTRYSWVDTTRVGIFGHSAGGYDACHALLEFPDFYKVGVASSGDHDFRMEKDWWPEMYMGWPVDSTYNEVSNITMAGRLKGKLLIVHGGIDENVNPSATFKLAEALVKANKQFDMLIFPSQHHGYASYVNDYFIKKRWNYFVENLLGAKPIWDFALK